MKGNKSSTTLSPENRDGLLETLKGRFEKNMVLR
jgi:hypothetical protein